ncbi:uncharacterized protein METZ01_LOCUS297075, partial [marine metagenome]
MKIPHLILTFFIIANISLSTVRADILDDLFEENQAAKKSINSLQMDCQELTVQCKERAAALQSSDSFSKNFEEALQRNIHEWPNNELDIIKEALNLRNFADNRFKKGFFGQASEQYDKASQMIFDVLVKANQLFEENLRVGEKYLYERDKPEWAIAYFNTALKYAPGDERVKRGIDVINFRINYEKDIAESEKLIAIGDDAEAIFLLEKLLSGSPDEKRMEIQKLLAKAKANLKIKEVEGYAQEFSDAYENGEDKTQILSKIENRLATYGEDSTTITLQKLRDKIIEETYAQSFQDLQDAFINKTKELEELYALTSSLVEKYPSKGDLKDLRDKIIEETYAQSFQDLQDAFINKTKE